MDTDFWVGTRIETDTTDGHGFLGWDTDIDGYNGWTRIETDTTDGHGFIFFF
jgi:hypothetical protein